MDWGMTLLIVYGTLCVRWFLILFVHPENHTFYVYGVWSTLYSGATTNCVYIAWAETEESDVWNKKQGFITLNVAGGAIFSTMKPSWTLHTYKYKCTKRVWTLRKKQKIYDFFLVYVRRRTKKNSLFFDFFTFFFGNYCTNAELNGVMVFS